MWSRYHRLGGSGSTVWACCLARGTGESGASDGAGDGLLGPSDGIFIGLVGAPRSNVADSSRMHRPSTAVECEGKSQLCSDLRVMSVS